MNHGHHNDGEPSRFAKAVTNEGFLFTSRIWIMLFSAAAAVLGFFAVTMLNDIRGSIADVRRDVSSLDRRYNEDRVTMADRVGRVEGQVGELKGSVETHRGRLNDIDTDRRAMWQRLFEMGRSRPNPNPKPD